MQHTWPAYRDALNALLTENPLPEPLAHPLRPTTVVLADQNLETPAEDVLDYAHDAVETGLLPGDHLLPFREADAVAPLFAQAQARPRPGWRSSDTVRPNGLGRSASALALTAWRVAASSRRPAWSTVGMAQSATMDDRR